MTVAEMIEACAEKYRSLEYRKKAHKQRARLLIGRLLFTANNHKRDSSMGGHGLPAPASPPTVAIDNS